METTKTATRDSTAPSAEATNHIGLSEKQLYQALSRTHGSGTVLTEQYKKTFSKRKAEAKMDYKDQVFPDLDGRAIVVSIEKPDSSV